MGAYHSVSVIVPVFNEVIVIGDAISTIDTFLRLHFNDYEIIIVESGSTDGTADACDVLAKRHACVRVVHEGMRHGFGAALQLGYQHSTKDLVWTIPADVPFPLQAIQQALPLFDHCDCVLSYRVADPRHRWRRIQSFAYNILVKAVLGLEVKHVNSAFKVFRRSVVQDMELISKGWLIDVELLYRLKQKRIPFVEIPVELVDRPSGTSSIHLLTPLLILKELFQFILGDGRHTR